MTYFCNEDPIDKQHRERIKRLSHGFRTLLRAFERSTSMTQAEKQQAIDDARKVLEEHADSYVFRA